LINCLKDHLRVLRENEDHIQHSFDKRYSLKELINFYDRELIIKLIDRSKKSNACSDIILWYIPKLCTLLYKVSLNLRTIKPPLVNLRNKIQIILKNMIIKNSSLRAFLSFLINSSLINFYNVSNTAHRYF
jgi:hypothetical protein